MFDKIVYYDPSSSTGLRWKITILSHGDKGKVVVKAGDEVGSNFKKPDGLPKCSAFVFEGKRYRNHRVIWELFEGTIPEGMVIDHLDGNPWNNDITNLALKSVKGNSRNTKKSNRNSSGFVGVSIYSTSGNFYSIARWYDENDVPRSKSFSHKRYGEQLATQLAAEYRAKIISNLNEQGAGYTERHVK